jgi:hypothetical protein
MADTRLMVCEYFVHVLHLVSLWTYTSKCGVLTKGWIFRENLLLSV